MPYQQLRHHHLGDLVLFLMGRRRRFRVTGTSMLPVLEPGQEVLIQPLPASTGIHGGSPVEEGDLVIARHPFHPDLRLIKRVITVREDETYVLMGDNPQRGSSTDSRSFGAVSADHILGKVLCRFP